MIIERRYDIDWLRVFAVMLLFFWHSEQIFDIYLDWYVKNETLSPMLTHLIFDIAQPWFMPIFFLLAGASTWYALRFRSGRMYKKERFKRLLLPFIFGILVIIPPQSYYGIRNHSGYSESFISFYTHFFNVYFADINGYFMGGFTPAHLWFIFYLYIFSLVALPFFLYLRTEAGHRFIERLVTLLSKTGMVVILALPLVVANSIPIYPNPLFFILFFVYGYILMTDRRLEEMIDRQKRLMLFLGPGVHTIILIVFWAEAWSLQIPFWDMNSPANIPRWYGYLRLIYISSFVPLFTVLAMLGYGKKYLNFTNKFLKYFGEASYPFYILHQTVIVTIGFYVVQWNVGVLIKYVTIVISAFVITALLYDLFIKRNNIGRFLFGLKAIPKKMLS